MAWGVSRTPGDHKPPLSGAFHFTDLSLSFKPDRKKFHGARRTLGSLSVDSAAGRVLKVKEDNKVLSTLHLRNDSEVFTLLAGERVAAAVGGNIFLYDVRTGTELRRFGAHRAHIRALARSPDGRYLVSVAADETVRVTSVEDPQRLVAIFVSGNEWVAWTPQGYYAASPGGERLMGWQVSNGPDKLASFYPSVQFRALLYRPDVLGHLLAEGSLTKALETADKEKGGAKAATVQVDEVLPPRVTLAAPKLKDAKTTNAAVEVEVVAQGTGKLPVVSVQLLLDGRPYEGGKSLRKVAARPGAAVKEAWTVEMPPGEHLLRALARSEASMGLSDDLEVVYEMPVPKAHLYLLAIGINAYADKNLKLGCAVQDARELEKTFRDKSKELFDVETRVLIDGTGDPRGDPRRTEMAEVADEDAGHGE